MNLPNHEQAVVPPEKLSDYLLSLSHPVGRSKAVFFRGLGYDENNTGRLAEALLNIAHSGDVRDTIETEYGVKYVIPGELTGQAGQMAQVQTVWIVDKGQTAPRFVTAYPLGEEE
jgi:hypothetical protein